MALALEVPGLIRDMVADEQTRREIYDGCRDIARERGWERVRFQWMHHEASGGYSLVVWCDAVG